MDSLKFTNKICLKRIQKLNENVKSEIENNVIGIKRNKLKSCESASFIQNGPCCIVAPELPKCLDCHCESQNISEDFSNNECRFYAFRKLCYTERGLEIAGFLDPMKDPSKEDLDLWLPGTSPLANDIDSDVAKLVLTQVGDQFCHFLREEEDALKLYIENYRGEERPIAWKRFVKGVREICDVCRTTLFNFHWVCRQCGIAACIDCYKALKEGGSREEFELIRCTNNHLHILEELMLTQIFAGDAANTMRDISHNVRAKWGIPMDCGCKMAFAIEERRSNIRDGCKGNAECFCNNSVVDRRFATSKSEEISDLKQNVDDADVLQFLCSSGIIDNDNPFVENCFKRSTSDVSTANIKIEPNADFSHSAFSRFVLWHTSKLERSSFSQRIMFSSESLLTHPNVPHSWLCEGKLLRLLKPTLLDNYFLFSEQWIRGQPIIVSNLSDNLDPNLWQPSSFARDFGDIKNDLVNCLSGNIVPNQPMRVFWEGFEYYEKRLKDVYGNSMLLMLKDWPSSADFAEVHQSRFLDLMKALPMKEYTTRNGQLNLASRLPDCYVRPDLGPKMYNAYGSSMHLAKGTTKLHLDISDAINLLIYVGIPKDCDRKKFEDEAIKAMEEAGCDAMSQNRVKENGELPGALWHIYHSKDCDKIRDFLNKVSLELGKPLKPRHDPIHDQDWYLDGPLRARLLNEYNVKGYAIVQCQGDAIFIPPGAPHQVKNLHDCIKAAVDFVSPENIKECLRITQEFRKLSDSHQNHEDKLQIKNIIYHAVKDMSFVLDSRSPP